MLNDARECVIHQIETAFLKVSRGEGITLHQAGAIDNWADEDAQIEARRLDTDRDWREVPEDWIAGRSPVLSWLDAEGFRYYIPAYMIWTLKNFQTSASIASDETIHALRMSNQLGHDPCSLECWKLLNHSQSAAICFFLEFLEQFGEENICAMDVKRALDRHWRRFVKT